MSATRTQVYLTEHQRRRIDDIAEAQGLTLAEVVRRAVDLYLDGAGPSPQTALATTFGALPDASVPSRDGWDRG